MKRAKTVLLLVSTAFSLLSCRTISFGDASSSQAMTFAEQLGLGYNLGNTLDATGGTQGYKIENFETSWGAPVTTKAIFEDLKSRGFSTIRIPVAWSNLMGANYEINADLMDRVQAIVDMVLSSGMHAIVNIHWDGGWITRFPTDYDATMLKYQRIWTQIAERFRDYDDRLVFESMNEEGCFNDLWNRYSGAGDKELAYDLLNHVNRAFVDLVRSSGGGNASRYLLVAGYCTDIDLTCDPMFHVPYDPAGHVMVSVHYYAPSTFTILEEDADWGKAAAAWGSESEIARVVADMAKVKARFIDNGVPVVLGEYGTVIRNKDPQSVRQYLTEVTRTAWADGICPILWGASGDHYDRRALSFTDPLVGEMFAEVAWTARPALPERVGVARVPDQIDVQFDARRLPAAAASTQTGAGSVPLNEPIRGDSSNDLAATIGPVTIVMNTDTSFTSNDPIPGGDMRVVDFLGRKALQVTQNFNGEIRIAFVLDEPVALAGYTTLSFSVAGLDGSGGVYNCGLLYTDAKPSGERIGSFYVSPVSSTQWTSVEADLVQDEVWGHNFSQDRVLYCIQFWTNQSKTLYISDLSLR